MYNIWSLAEYWPPSSSHSVSASPLFAVCPWNIPLLPLPSLPLHSCFILHFFNHSLLHLQLSFSFLTVCFAIHSFSYASVCISPGIQFFSLSDKTIKRSMLSGAVIHNDIIFFHLQSKAIARQGFFSYWKPCKYVPVRRVEGQRTIQWWEILLLCSYAPRGVKCRMP